MKNCKHCGFETNNGDTCLVCEQLRIINAKCNVIIETVKEINKNLSILLTPVKNITPEELIKLIDNNYGKSSKDSCLSDNELKRMWGDN